MLIMVYVEIVSVDWQCVLEMLGVVSYLDKDSVFKGGNKWGLVVKDEEFFVDGEVKYYGQVIGMICVKFVFEVWVVVD